MGMMRRRRFNINLFRGGSESEKWIVMVMVVLGIMMMITDQCWAQPQQQQQHQQQDSSITSCVNQLIPCFNYLNLRGSHDNPPDSCCNPLKSVIKSNPECLCSMISIKATNAAQQYGINLTDAQQLPGRCGQHVNPIACLTTATGSPNSKNSVTNSVSSSPLVSSQSITSMPMVALFIIFSFLYLWRSM